MASTSSNPTASSSASTSSPNLPANKYTSIPQSNFDITDQNFKIWKCYAPFLYDFLIVQSLEYPSLTCQWYDRPYTSTDSSKVSTQRILMGTHSEQSDKNSVIIKQVKIPTPEAAIDIRSYQNMTQCTHLPLLFVFSIWRVFNQWI